MAVRTINGNGYSNGGPQLTWSSAIGITLFAMTMFGVGASWVTNENTHLRQEIDGLRTYSLRKDQEIVVELRRREDELKSWQIRMEQVLVDRNKEFPTQFEYKAFVKSNDDLWERQSRINQRTMDTFLLAKAWEAWRGERERLISDILHRLEVQEARK